VKHFAQPIDFLVKNKELLVKSFLSLGEYTKPYKDIIVLVIAELEGGKRYA
jgi:hypothetical protein